MVVGALVLVGFFLTVRAKERAGEEPLLSTALFRNRTSNLGLVTQNTQWLMLIGVSFVVSAYLQTVRSYDAIETGVIFTAATLGLLVSSIAAERLAKRYPRRTVYGDDPVPPGDHQVRAEFDYDGDRLDKGGNLALYVDGTKAGEGRIDATQPNTFSADETTDIGADNATPVSDDYGPKNTSFTGRIHWIQLDTDSATDNNHLVDPEHLLRIAMARQ
jgi:hypothetical protein